MMPGSRVQDKTTWDLGYTIADDAASKQIYVPLWNTDYIDTDKMTVDWGMALPLQSRVNTVGMVLIICLLIHIINYVVTFGCAITSRYPNKYAVVADN